MRHYSLPPSQLQSHYGPQRGVTQRIQQLLPIIWLPVHIHTQYKARKIYFTVPLPDFKQHWTTLFRDDILFPGHSTVISFLKSATISKNAPPLNYVSAKHLISPCPPSLFKYLDKSNPYRQVWLDLYKEEK